MRVGVDEAGKGPVLGPMVAAAVAVPGPDVLPDGVADSKRLAAGRRETIAEQLLARDAVRVGVATVPVERIDDAATDMNSLTVAAHATALDAALLDREADGAVAAPDGATTSTDGAATSPDDAATSPGDAVTPPGDATTPPNDAVACPEATHAVVDGARAALDGGTLASSVLVERGCAVLADAGDTSEERFARRLADASAGEHRVRARHGADDDDPVVAAASIVAKVERDARVAALAADYGDVGSGYPSDPTTRAFLAEYVDEHGELPDCARTSWQTCSDVLAAAAQSGLDEF